MTTDCIKAQAIHEASLELLGEPGVMLQHDEIASALIARGAKRGDKADVLRLPREMIDEALAACPKRFDLCDARGAATTLTATSPPVVWSCPGIALWRDGQHRPYTSADMAASARLLERLDNVHAVFGMSMDDVPPPARDAVGLRVIAENSTKHVRALCFSPKGSELMKRMKPVVGDFPWFSIGFTAHGPLRWTNLALEVFRQTAGCGIPVSVNGEPMAGVSGPVTLAGSAAVGNAEILAGIVVNQTLEPGRACVYNLGLAHVLDMRTAIAVTGGPENHLLAQVAALMGRFYDLPSASWVSTESMCPDAQAAIEKMMGFHTHMAEGVSCIWGLGQLESELTFSPAQAVIDNEMISYCRRYLRGVEVNESTLATQVTRSVGIAGSFLEHDHTLDNYRQELFSPAVLFRKRRQDWNDLGKPTLERRAQELADELAARPVQTALDDGQIRALREMTDRFVKEL